MRNRGGGRQGWVTDPTPQGVWETELGAEHLAMGRSPQGLPGFYSLPDVSGVSTGGVSTGGFSIGGGEARTFPRR